MICLYKDHQGIAALRETINFLNREVDVLRQAVRVSEAQNEHLVEQLSVSQLERRELLDRLLFVMGAVPVPVPQESIVPMRPIHQHPLMPTVSGEPIPYSNINDYCRQAEMEEARQSADYFRRMAEDSMKEANVNQTSS